MIIHMNFEDTSNNSQKSLAKYFLHLILIIFIESTHSDRLKQNETINGLHP